MIKFIHRLFFAAGFIMILMHPASAQETTSQPSPLLMAAGSLAQAMNDIMAAYAAQGGARFTAQYGPSGKLRQEIEAGKKVDVFASASTDHTEALAAKKLLGASYVFTHNDLCVAARPELKLTEANLLEVLSRADVRLATSTPVSDPMGDYTWEFFRNAERKQDGLYQIFTTKALKLSGASAPQPGAKPPYVTAFEEDKADAYVMYCTNAVATRKAVPQLEVVNIPQDLNVRSDYGIAAHSDSEQGRRFVEFTRSAAGQVILQKYGFR
jgi:molybdate transport system substrate-binding protein